MAVLSDPGVLHGVFQVNSVFGIVTQQLWQNCKVSCYYQNLNIVSFFRNVHNFKNVFKKFISAGSNVFFKDRKFLHAYDLQETSMLSLTQIWIVKTEQQENCQTVHSLLAGI